MGADIHGYVECKGTFGVLDDDDAQWHAAIDLGLLYGGRDYDAFGCLFGVRNYAGFRPLAAGRGLPPDATEQVRDAVRSWGADAHAMTWIGWAELARVDWDESAEAVDQRVHGYKVPPEGGRPVLTSKSFQDLRGRAEGDEWEQDGELFRVARMTRREAVPPGGEWAPVWATMRALAEVHGSEQVRLVVWFDG